MKYQISNIEWDATKREIRVNKLPRNCEIEADSPDEIADALSDEYGFCVKGFVKEEPDIKTQIKGVLRRYFEYDPETDEKNAEYDEDFSAQDAIDEILRIIR